MQAGRRVSTRSGASASVARVVDEILASGGHDDLPLEAVDPVSWARREAFPQAASAAVQRRSSV